MHASTDTNDELSRVAHEIVTRSVAAFLVRRHGVRLAGAEAR